MRAVDLTAVIPTIAGYRFREYGDSDDAWKLVKARVFCALRGADAASASEMVSVRFVDGTERFLNPDDEVEIGPV
jgi:hypothetical protein